MPDLLAALYHLPDLTPALEEAQRNGFQVRRVLPPEKPIVLAWIERHFSAAWAAECDVAFSRQPPACFVATHDEVLCGFAAYEATCRNFFGPFGVHPDFRGHHLGKALLLQALHAMRAEGYAYAIIGGVGPVDFFQKTVNAMVIENSAPGIYQGMLRPPREV